MCHKMSEKGSESVAKSTQAMAGVLVGRFDHALDPKKRLTIPSGWRLVLGNPEYVYAMPDPRERCVNIMPKDEMDAMLAQLRKKALFDPAQSKLLQVIGANSDLLMLDSQGRIRIADKLLRFANLTTTVAMVGSVRMIKLWDPQALAPEGEVDQDSLSAALSAAGWCG